MSNWNAITLYDNEPNTYFRETYSWKDGIEDLISIMYENGCEDMYKDAEVLEKEYKKVKRLTRKEMLRLLSLTDKFKPISDVPRPNLETLKPVLPNIFDCIKDLIL